MNRKTNILILTFLASLFAWQSVKAQTIPTDDSLAVLVNPALENILTRRSVREFQPRPVEAAKVNLMLRAAMAAPTLLDMQPWHFVVLNRRKDIEAYAGNNHHSEMIRGAQVVIVVCGDTARMAQGQSREAWVQDVSAATENLLLAAHSMGLGAVWTTGYPVERKVGYIRQRLGLPGNLIPLASVLIGYPADNGQPKDKWDPAKISWGIKAEGTLR